MARSRHLALVLLLCLVIVFATILALWLPAGAQLVAAEQSPYRVSEIVVHRGPGINAYPIVSGSRVVWTESDIMSPPKGIFGRDLATGQEFTVPVADFSFTPPDLDGDIVVTIENKSDSGKSVVGYKISSGTRFTVAEPKWGADFFRWYVRVAGNYVAWLEGSLDSQNVYVYDVRTGQASPITTTPDTRDGLDISGKVVAWMDHRNVPTAGTGIERYYQDIYAYDLTQKREVRVSSRPEHVLAPAVTGSTVVWAAERNGLWQILGYDLTVGREFNIAEVAGLYGPVAADGDLVVWSASGQYDSDIFGYDLKLRQGFVISRAIGNQLAPSISGRTVVWSDYRASGVGKYEGHSDVYGAQIEPGPAPAPPVVGAPEAADARVEVVWPHSGVPGTDADRANVSAWLFWPGTLNLTPCQWRPKVYLWQSLNNQPARLVAAATLSGRYSGSNRAIPSWDFNDVDVSAARDPRNKIYFFVTIDGVDGRTSIWAHAADARTVYPVQDVPAGVAASSGPVEAKIQIVWPHENAPVERAKLVNVTATVFTPGTLLSVPTDWSGTVRLYRSLNNGIAEPVAVGVKRVVLGRGFSYPVWDFNDVDVSAATDPANKYYFTLQVVGVQTFTNVWAHGADARTYFPTMDVPTASCQ